MQLTLRHNLNHLVGSADVLLLTLDTLRYDVAQDAWRDGDLTTLAAYLGEDGWEQRHSPASFTYAAHHAFFAGFLPTPTAPGPHPRLFASRFALSETSIDETYVFEESTLPEALSARDYRAICIGGTGFFNPANALGRVLPAYFDESHWSDELGVANQHSEVHQVDLAISRLEATSDQRVFLFINFSAIHQPNWFYAEDSHDGKTQQDSLHSHCAALEAVDAELGRLFQACRRRGPTFCIVCSDHGTAYGESGHCGHRVGHEVVWNVPYAEFML